MSETGAPDAPPDAPPLASLSPRSPLSPRSTLSPRSPPRQLSSSLPDHIDPSFSAIDIHTPVPPASNPERKSVPAPERSWLCCTTYKDRHKFMTIIQELELTPVQKEILETRYLSLLQNLQKRTRNHAIVFYIGHFIITVGSLFVPALLSIQNSDREYALTGGAFNVHIYWSTFIISLLVTIWNAILTLFRIDKKYYFLNTILERLRSEGWQYVSLTGRYSGHLTGKDKPTHANQFVHFTHYIEKMKMKQIEEEYYRTDEKAQAPTTSASTSTIVGGTTSYATSGANQVVVPIELYAPSPNKPIPSMTQVPEDIRMAHETLSQQRSPLEQSFTQLNSSYKIPSVYSSLSPSASSASSDSSSSTPSVPSDSSSSTPSVPSASSSTPSVPTGLVSSTISTYRQMRKNHEQAHPHT